MPVAMVSVTASAPPGEDEECDQQNGKEREKEVMWVRIISVWRQMSVWAGREIVRTEHPDNRCDNERNESDARENVQKKTPAPMAPSGIIALRAVGRRDGRGLCVLHREILSDTNADLAHR